MKKLIHRMHTFQVSLYNYPPMEEGKIRAKCDESLMLPLDEVCTATYFEELTCPHCIATLSEA